MRHKLCGAWQKCVASACEIVCSRVYLYMACFVGTETDSDTHAALAVGTLQQERLARECEGARCVLCADERELE